MNSYIVSIRPKWVEKIASGEKTIEVRKTAPKEVPFKAYIYCSHGNDKENYMLGRRGKVIGEFVCDKVIRTCGWRLRGDTQQCAKRTSEEEFFPRSACLPIDEIVDYAGNENREVIGWHISDLKIYDKPKELSEFVTAREKDNCDMCGVAWESWNGDWHCTQKHCDGYHLSRPPQSYMRVEKWGE